MSAQINRLRGGLANWRTILGLLLVPLTVAGVLLWGLWSPTERLDTVTAAVVNQDKPVTIDGQLVPLGRVLAAQLISGDTKQNFTWQLTDAADAKNGLDDGRYATVITIPKNFSAAATSAAGAATGDIAKAHTATIDIATSERGRLLDSAISGIVTATATKVLNEQLGSQFVGSVFVGMAEIGKGIGQAADGATALASGGQTLASSADQLTSGANELVTGTQQLAAGTATLSNGTAALVSGLGEFAGGVRQAADGAAQLSSLANIYVNGANGVLGGMKESAPMLIKQLQTLYGLIDSGTVPLPPGQTKDAALAQLQDAIAQLSDMQGQLEQLVGAGQALQKGVHTATAGQARLAALAAELASKTQQLATGAQQLAANAPGLTAGTSQLASGMGQLATGAQQAADGTSSLAQGLHQAADEIPNYTKSERERLGEIATRPVQAQGASDKLFNAAGAPLFGGIALWAGALASFLTLAPLWRRTREAARSVGYIALRSALPAIWLGALQGAIVGVILPAVLGYNPAQWGLFCGLALLAGVVFSLFNQGISALLGGFGRFIAFAMLVVALAIGVISTTPQLLQKIGDASPIGALFAGFQAIAAETTGVATATLVLVLWGAAGFALTTFAVIRKRALG